MLKCIFFKKRGDLSLPRRCLATVLYVSWVKSAAVPSPALLSRNLTSVYIYLYILMFMGEETSLLPHPASSNWPCVPDRYLRQVWEGCVRCQPGLPGHGEPLPHKLLHLLLLWWVKALLESKSCSFILVRVCTRAVKLTFMSRHRWDLNRHSSSWYFFTGVKWNVKYHIWCFSSDA